MKQNDKQALAITLTLSCINKDSNGEGVCVTQERRATRNVDFAEFEVNIVKAAMIRRSTESLAPIILIIIRF